MTTNFTPGPWHAVDFIQGDEGNLIDDHYNSVMAGIGFTDAETGSVGFQISGCISRADADLMAAAPEMYAALVRAEKKIASIVEVIGAAVEREEGRITPAYQLLKDVRSAIAKAQGGAA